MEKFPPLSELVMAFRRHMFVFAGIVILGMVVSILYALKQPRSYQTAAMIQILQPTIQEPLARNSASGATLQRLQMVEQRLMARDNLTKIINEHNLYADAGDVPISEKVLRLRLATTVERIIDPSLRWRSDISPTALTIMVRDGDPETAALVANEFVETLLQQSRETGAAQAQEALSFFESEETRVGNEIAALDTEISIFKQENSDVMSEGLKNLRAQLVPLEESILLVEGKIISLRNEVANVENSAFASKLTRLEEQLSLLAGKRQNILSQISLGPEVDREFIALNRKLKQLTAQYSVITKSRSEAEMSQMLEATRQSAEFEVLETALVPLNPIAPNRKKIVLTGTAISMVIALMLIIFLELKKPVIRTSSQMARRLDLTPVVSIPALRAPRRALFSNLLQWVKRSRA